MSKEIPLQQDMFSSEWKDMRSRTQRQRDRQRNLPQQEEMFSQREFGQYVNPHPKMKFHPDEKLELSIQDPRTPEEIERDQWREIEKQTYRMFAGEKDLPEQQDEACDLPEEGQDDIETALDDLREAAAEEPDELGSKAALFLDLVKLCQEQAATLWIAPAYESKYLAQIAVTARLAQAAGMTDAEIQAAIQIGTLRGNARNQSSPSRLPNT